VGAFWADAQSLFQTAQAGTEDCDLAILIGHGGEIHMLPAEGWTWAGLLAHHGARTAYRVTRERGRILVDGRCGPQSCRLEYASPGAQARYLLDTSLAPACSMALPGRVEGCRRLT
jgi:hypothetical protein